MPDLVPSDALLPLVDDIVAVADAQFGDGYIPESKIRRSVAPGGNDHLLVALADSDGVRLVRAPHDASEDERADATIAPEAEIAGFTLYVIHEREGLAEYLNIDRENYPEELRDACAVGVPRSIAVAGDHQRNGHGTRMMGACVDILDHTRCDVLCLVAWESGGGVRLAGILDDTSFERVNRVDGYWACESVREDYQCSVCGEPPCQCAAVIYLRDSTRSAARC